MQQSFKNRFSKIDWDAKTQLEEPISVSCESCFYNNLGDIQLLDFYLTGNKRISLFFKDRRLIAKIGKGRTAKSFQLQTMVWDISLSRVEYDVKIKLKIS